MSLGSFLNRQRQKRIYKAAYREGEEAALDASDDIISQVGFEHGVRGEDPEDGFEEALDASEDQDEIEEMIFGDDDGDDEDDEDDD